MKTPKALSIALLIGAMLVGVAALAHAPERVPCPGYDTVAGYGTGYGMGSDMLDGYGGTAGYRVCHDTMVGHSACFGVGMRTHMPELTTENASEIAMAACGGIQLNRLDLIEKIQSE